MRIVMTIHALHGGGAERQIAELANYLASQGNDVSLVTLDRVENDRYRVDSTVQRIGLDLMGESQNLWQAFWANRRRISKLRSLIQELSPDVVISFTDKMNIMTLSLQRAIPVIVAERSDPRKQRLPWRWEAWRDRVYPRAACIVALTNSIANELKRRFPKNRVIVIPNAVEIPGSNEHLKNNSEITATIAPPTPAYGKDSPKFNREIRRALAVGRLSSEKGFDLLLQAWSKGGSDLRNWELVIAGEGPERNRLENEITQLKLTDSVKLIGWCENITTQYLQADLFILPSHYEAMSRSLLEALSYSLPVVVTEATDGLDSLVINGTNGWLVPTGNVTVLAEAIVDAAGDPQRLERFGEASYQLVQQHAWPNIGPQWLRLIHSVVEM